MSVQLNKNPANGVHPILESETRPGETIRYRVKDPLTNQATEWADNIPDVQAAWNAVMPEPEPEIPTIPLLPKNTSV